MTLYKNSKHAYLKTEYMYAKEATIFGTFKTCTNTQTGTKIYMKKIKRKK